MAVITVIGSRVTGASFEARTVMSACATSVATLVGESVGVLMFVGGMFVAVGADVAVDSTGYGTIRRGAGLHTSITQRTIGRVGGTAGGEHQRQQEDHTPPALQQHQVFLSMSTASYTCSGLNGAPLSIQVSVIFFQALLGVRHL